MSFLANLLNIVWVGVVFVTMISILVAAHELGHYLFARLFGMGVEEFAIGFGKKPLVTWMRRFYTVPVVPGQRIGREEEAETNAAGMSAVLEGKSDQDRIEVLEDGKLLRERTDFTIRPYPLGGFVRIKGMLPDEEGSETKVAGGFYSKAPWQRLIVLFAGPLFSVIAGIILLVGVYTIDGSERTSDQPVIEVLTSEGPAGKAGILPGDRVTAIDGKPISTFYEMVVIVRDSADRTLRFDVDRKGKPMQFSVTPKLGDLPSPVFGPGMELTAETKRQGKIEASPGSEIKKLSLAEATLEAAKFPEKAVTGLVRVFIKPAEFEQNVGGPGTMVRATSLAIRMGAWKVVELAGLLSISVGIFNLLPAGPLDGGQMTIAIAEMLRGGRRLSFKVQTAFGTLGFIFVALLISSALIVDVKRATAKPPAQSEVKKR